MGFHVSDALPKDGAGGGGGVTTGVGAGGDGGGGGGVTTGVGAGGEGGGGGVTTGVGAGGECGGATTVGVLGLAIWGLTRRPVTSGRDSKSRADRELDGLVERAVLDPEEFTWLLATGNVLDTFPEGTAMPPEGSSAEPNMLIPVVVV
ncbi:MAG: hypothetical protein ACREIM_01930 [Nitrospiraceae bacterium]